MATGANNPPDNQNKINQNVTKAQETAHQKIDQAANKATGATYQAANKVHEAADRAPEAVAQTIDQVSDKAKDVVDKASDSLKQTAVQASTQLQQAQREMIDKAYAVKTNASQSLYEAAQKLRAEVRTGDGAPVQQAEAIAESLEKMGRYLESNTFEEIESDARRTIQKNPWQSVGAAALVGFVMARIFGGRRR